MNNTNTNKMEATTKLESALNTYSTKSTGETYTNEEGISYHYETYTLNYNNTPYWLSNLFAKAAKENNANHAKQFNNNNTSFLFDRSAYKGQPNGKITMKKLIIEG
jgi:hypothetical protein